MEFTKDIRSYTALPDADCENCDYMKLNDPRSGGHCYMFKDAPRLKCGQFTQAGTCGATR